MFKKLRPTIAFMVLMSFIGSSFPTPAFSQLSVENQLPWMPRPGVRLDLSAPFIPAELKGITIHPENPFMFDFIIYRGDQALTNGQKQEEYKKLIKYFLASVAIPDEDQWVNLSPYEKDRIIKDDFGKTLMGRDLLAQDYILKQITASLIYPEKSLGKEFWSRVYAKAQAQYGTTNVPVNTFNKVWIIPDDALIYEKGNTAYVLKNHLKVMLEEDYLSLRKHLKGTGPMRSWGQSPSVNTIGSQIVRQLILPQLETEVNQGRNFAMLRQVYSGMLLAAWFKRTLRRSILGRVYADRSKVRGVDQNPENNEAIYQRYLQAYKKGVFNYIKEDADSLTGQPIPRKYFSGGMYSFAGEPIGTTEKLNSASAAMVAAQISGADTVQTVMDRAMNSNVMPATKFYNFGQFRAAMERGGLDEKLHEVRADRVVLEKYLPLLKKAFKDRKPGIDRLIETVDFSAGKPITNVGFALWSELLGRSKIIPFDLIAIIEAAIEGNTIDALNKSFEAYQFIWEDHKGVYEITGTMENFDPVLGRFALDTRPGWIMVSQLLAITRPKDGQLLWGRPVSDELLLRIDETNFRKLGIDMRNRPSAPELRRALFDRIAEIDSQKEIDDLRRAQEKEEVVRAYEVVRSKTSDMEMTMQGLRFSNAAMASQQERQIGPSSQLLEELKRGSLEYFLRLRDVYGVATVGPETNITVTAERPKRIRDKMPEYVPPEDGFRNIDDVIRAIEGGYFISTFTYAGMYILKYRINLRSNMAGISPADIQILIKNVTNEMNKLGSIIPKTKIISASASEAGPGQGIKISLNPDYYIRAGKTVMSEENLELLKKAVAARIDSRRKLIKLSNNHPAWKGKPSDNMVNLALIYLITPGKKLVIPQPLPRDSFYFWNLNIGIRDVATEPPAEERETGNPLGGIDMNSANLNLHIRRDGAGMPLPLSQQDLAQLGDIQGLEPVILSIKPASQTPLFSSQANP